MYIDARKLPNGSSFDTDIAIIGGGPAGITLTRSFAGRKTRIMIVEAGGREFDADVQSLYEGENAGIEYPLALNRMRFFGGSSNHWGGYCRPLDPIDFEKRDWVPYSGWPFAIDELEPYYEPASEIVEVAPGKYADKQYWQEQTGETLPDPLTGRMRVRYVHFSPPTRFGTRYGEDLEKAGNVQVMLNANVSNIDSTDDARAVTKFDIKTLNGLEHSVRARIYVVATGGLENARMLLLSNKRMQAGLGNQNDLVGRFFMEHPHLTGFGEIVVADLKRLPELYRDRLIIEGRPCKAAFNPSAEFLRERRLLNATFMGGIAGHYQADTKSNWDRTPRHIEMLQTAKYFLTDNGGPADPEKPDEIGHWMGLGCACEQEPNPDSRVMLSTDQKDPLGLPRIKLDWRLTEQDRRSVVEHMRSLAMEMGAWGIGRMLIGVEDDGKWPELVAGGSHHMGTTRMHDDPKQGVVDRNCKVHGIDNLYVAGSSVFPTSGAANPTLSLVALALRLGDHLRARV